MSSPADFLLSILAGRQQKSDAMSAYNYNNFQQRSPTQYSQRYGSIEPINVKRTPENKLVMNAINSVDPVSGQPNFGRNGITGAQVAGALDRTTVTGRLPTPVYQGAYGATPAMAEGQMAARLGGMAARGAMGAGLGAIGNAIFPQMVGGSYPVGSILPADDLSLSPVTGYVMIDENFNKVPVLPAEMEALALAPLEGSLLFSRSGQGTQQAGTQAILFPQDYVSQGGQAKGYAQTPQVSIAEVPFLGSNAVNPNIASAYIPPANSSNSGQYIVQQGDTLGQIAARVGTDLPSLAAMNGISNPDLIQVGQILNTIAQQASQQGTQQAPLPQQASQQGTPYTIQQGDTLSQIAARFGVDMTTLAALNNILNPNLIQAGSQLQIPQQFMASR